MNDKPYVIKVGNEYTVKSSGTKGTVLKIELNTGFDGHYYTVKFVDATSIYFLTYKSNSVHYKNYGDVAEFTTTLDYLIPVDIVPPLSGNSVIYWNNVGQIMRKDTEGNITPAIDPKYWIDECDANWYKWGQSLADSLNKTTCSHNWVTTIGFSSQYTDCSKCGAKKEDSI